MLYARGRRHYRAAEREIERERGERAVLLIPERKKKFFVVAAISFLFIVIAHVFYIGYQIGGSRNG
ncbi:hypothetical protein AGMMS49975_18500 [Clostridia bacterium]|nr:hypothetical protein AGMMS49975_18500 [Clostridia bacterium]